MGPNIWMKLWKQKSGGCYSSTWMPMVWESRTQLSHMSGLFKCPHTLYVVNLPQRYYIVHCSCDCIHSLLNETYCYFPRNYFSIFLSTFLISLQTVLVKMQLAPGTVAESRFDGSVCFTGWWDLLCSWSCLHQTGRAHHAASPSGRHQSCRVSLQFVSYRPLSWQAVGLFEMNSACVAADGLNQSPNNT